MLIRPQGMSERDWVTHLAKEAEAWQALLKSDGWKLYDEYMKNEQAGIEASMVKAETGDIAMKLLGAYNTITAMRRFPVRSLEMTLQQLQKK